MKKIVIHKPGGYERLELENHPDPVPGEGEVLVKVEAAGVNYADCIVRWGMYESAKKFVGWPITPGFEFAGTVVALGPGTPSPLGGEGWGEGSKVFGVTRFGGYASHVVVPRHQLFPVPAGWSMETAAGFPAVFLTAYHALFQLIRLRPGMKILVHSAAGGVGGALVQLAKAADCRVAGVVGASRKVQAVRDLGADWVIDKSREILWQRAEEIAPEGYDVVLDANGPSTLKQSYEHLASSGKLICYGFHTFFPKQGGRVNYLKIAWNYLQTPRFNPLAMTAANKSVLAFNLSFLFHRRDFFAEAMADLLKWIREGKIKPATTTAFPMEKAADAHRALESGQTIGKLVLTF